MDSPLPDIQDRIDRLEALDPAEVPEPAAEIADLLGALLEDGLEDQV